MKYFNRGRSGTLQRSGGNARIQTFRFRPRFQAFRAATRNVQPGRRFRGKQTSNISFRSGFTRDITGSRKRVVMRDGLLTVMTRKHRQDDEDEDEEPSVAEPSSSSSGRKLVKATTSGIMVNVLASPSWNRRQQLENVEENDQVDSDNVEMLTLDDLPEVRKLSQGRVSQHDRDDRQSAVKRRPTRPLSTRFRGRLDSPESDAGSMVLVTNLHGGVSEEDITELFGNVGPIVGSKFIQPGVALVTYVSTDDALHACEVYNKRLLDGQPMYCAMFMQPSPQPKPVVAPMNAGSSQAVWQPPPWPVYSASDGSVKFTVRMP